LRSSRVEVVGHVRVLAVINSRVSCDRAMCLSHVSSGRLQLFNVNLKESISSICHRTKNIDVYMHNSSCPPRYLISSLQFPSYFRNGMSPDLGKMAQLSNAHCSLGFVEVYMLNSAMHTAAWASWRSEWQNSITTSRFHIYTVRLFRFLDYRTIYSTLS